MASDESQPPPLLARRPRRKWKIWLIACGFVAGAPIVGFLLWSRDEPPPDVSDLTVTPLSLPPAKNAFVALTALASKVDATPWAGDEELFVQLASGKVWDSVKAEKWLAANNDIWSEIDRVAAMTSSQGPRESFVDGHSTILVAPLSQLARLTSIRARQLYHAGHQTEALAWLITCLRACSHVEDSHSTLLAWLSGHAIKGTIGTTVQSLIIDPTFPSEFGAPLIQAIETSRPSVSGLADALRNENLMVQFTVEQLQHPPPSDHSDPDFDRLLTWSRRFPLLLKPHRMQRQHADQMRHFIGLIEADWPSLHAAELGHDNFLGTGWGRLNPDNLVGRMALRTMVEIVPSVVARRIRAQSFASATEALIAVRQHQIEHGSLPASLDELVPRYLPKVPLDYYDGKPIRYSLEHQAIWSVGKNDLNIDRGDTEWGIGDVVVQLSPAKSPSELPSK